MNIFNNYTDELLGKANTIHDKEIDNIQTRQALEFMINHAPEILRNSDDIFEIIVNIPIF